MTIAAANPFAEAGNRILGTIYRNRRRMATAFAMIFAAVLGYFAVAGGNGIAVYKQKRIDDKQLAKQIDDLKQENARLQAHIERLERDPDAIEHEAREKLHYTRPGEVIYTLRDPPTSGHAAPPGTASPSVASPAPASK